MRHRPRWGLLTLGAIGVAVLFAYPLWRTVFTGGRQQIPFQLVSPDQRRVLLEQPDRDLAATAYVSILTVVPVPPEVAPPPVPADAAIILSGRFTTIDAVHNAAGTVRIYRLRDDSVIMRFDEFKITNAPGLKVFLSSNEEVKTLADLSGVTSEWEAGLLAGTDGAQQFVIPRELPLSSYRTVVIVSEPLGQIYTVAPLK